MIKVSVEVGSVTDRFSVTVRAENIREALASVEESWPGDDLRLVYPIDPEVFFGEDPDAAAGPIELETPIHRGEVSGA